MRNAAAEHRSLEVDNIKVRFKNVNPRGISSLNGSFIGSDDQGSLKEGVNTYQISLEVFIGVL
jgi:hypothetical protein